MKMKHLRGKERKRRKSTIEKDNIQRDEKEGKSKPKQQQRSSGQSESGQAGFGIETRNGTKFTRFRILSLFDHYFVSIV